MPKVMWWMWRPPGVMFLNGPRSALIACVIARTAANVRKNEPADSSWRSLRRSSKWLQYRPCGSRADILATPPSRQQVAVGRAASVSAAVNLHRLFVEMGARCRCTPPFGLDHTNTAHGFTLGAHEVVMSDSQTP